MSLGNICQRERSKFVHMSDHIHTLEHMLKDHGLRKTTFRMEVLQVLKANEGRAIASDVIESALGQHDRITLYRTLKSFEKKGLIHLTSSLTGQAKYALCQHLCTEESHHDMHAHFHCDQCGETTCLDDQSATKSYQVPRGYEVKDVQVTLSGTCQQCS